MPVRPECPQADTERERFEAWVGERTSLSRDAKGDYLTTWAKITWAAWQAAAPSTVAQGERQDETMSGGVESRHVPAQEDRRQVGKALPVTADALSPTGQPCAHRAGVAPGPLTPSPETPAQRPDVRLFATPQTERESLLQAALGLARAEIRTLRNVAAAPSADARVGREPTEAMVQAGYAVSQRQSYFIDLLPDVWRAMYDAAIPEASADARDAARLDSGVILISELDEMGDTVFRVYRTDLRRAIDAAIAGATKP